MPIAERIRALIASASTIPSEEEIGLDDPIWEYVSPLVLNNELLGSATFISPGNALTAAHVLNLLTSKEKPLAPGEVVYGKTNHQMYAVRVNGLNTETQLMIAGVPSSHTDIAFLSFQTTLGATGPSERLTLAVSPPAVGSIVVAFGRPDIVEENNCLKSKCIQIVSRVVEVHSQGRDQRLPFACFRTDRDFHGGMSGGPVFNSDGHVCGLVCSGAVEPYVALIWQALASKIGHDAKGNLLESMISALDLLKQLNIPIVDANKFSISQDGLPLYHHGLGTFESPLHVDYTVSSPEFVESITVHTIFDGGMKISFVPLNTTNNNNLELGEMCIHYLIPTINAEVHVNPKDSTVTANWQPGEKLTGPIIEVLRENDLKNAKKAREMGVLFKERWEMDRFLGRHQ